MFIYGIYVFQQKIRSRHLPDHSNHIHPASEQCHILSIVGGPFFKFTTFRT